MASRSRKRRRERIKEESGSNASLPLVAPQTAGGADCGQMSVLADVSDAKQVRKDLGLVNQAIKKRWPVTETAMKKIVRRMMDVIEKTSVDVIGPEGMVFNDEAKADANSIAASKVIVQMSAMNQRDELAVIKAAEPKQGMTVNVGVKVDARTDERRHRTLAIAERIRAGRVLEQS